jgi:hypothetical protein
LPNRRKWDYDHVTRGDFSREPGVAGTFEYRGIQYLVEPVTPRRWRWRILPPLCVRGLREEAGEIDGGRDDAIQAAHAAIKSQALSALSGPAQ